MKFTLPRTSQCSKCPWKVSTDPYQIPNGYDLEKHKQLAQTIAEPGSIAGLSASMRAMACHHSSGQDGMYCVGWLNHQLGKGNNIALRLRMLRCENISKLAVWGNQHERFEDTLPGNKKSDT